MASYFTLTLDTTAPASPIISLEDGATYASQQLITATISTGDGATTGYQMKIWGDVDTTYNASIQNNEVGSAWITYNTSQQIKLATTDGNKTIYLKIRDDVYNASAQASDSIILDTTVAVVSITGPDLSKISKQTGKNVSSFSFSSDSDFVEYKVKVVGATGASEDTGTLIPTTNGSTNTSGTGTYPSSTPVSVQINGADLELAASGDGAKIIKVFVKEANGSWSV